MVIPTKAAAQYTRPVLNASDVNVQKWTLFDKFMYGGFGYGAFCLPSNFFKIIISVIFPPFGEIVNIIGNDVDQEFPYLNWKVISNLITFENFNQIIYSLLLTTLFYIPGLVYTLRNISDSDNKLI